MGNGKKGKSALGKVFDDDGIGGKFKRFLLIYAMIVVLLIAAAAAYDYFVVGRIDPTREKTTDFVEAVENGEVFAAYLSSDGSKVLYQYKKDVPADIRKKDVTEVHVWDFPDKTWYYADYTKFDNLTEKLYMNGLVILTGKFDKLLGQVLALIVSLSMPVIMIYFMFTMFSLVFAQMAGASKKYEISSDTGIGFSDVIGHDELISDVKQYISILRGKNESGKVKPPKGILFTGPPGTGKTLLAKAMAGEAGVPFIYLNTSSAIEMYVGVGARTIRECFSKARSMSPCVVFLDEIDAIGGGRGLNRTISSEDTQTLLALLQELDGFSGKERILVIAATNQPDSLDPALKRSGRFDREVIVNPPRNAAVRQEMLEYYTKKYDLADDVDLATFSRQLAGMTGADIANVCNEAAVVNMMRGGGSLSSVTMADLTQALDKVLLKGNRLGDKSLINEHDRKVVAVHEAGHAVMSFLLGMPISRISVQGTTSGVGGFVMREEPDSQFRSREYLEHSVMVAYAGRISEEISFGKGGVTGGAENDIEQATAILSRMLLKDGLLSDSLVDYTQLVRMQAIDPATVTKEIERASSMIYRKAETLLSDKYYLVESLSDRLLEEEVIDGNDAEQMLSDLMEQKVDK